jgi:hypothetical protein
MTYTKLIHAGKSKAYFLGTYIIKPKAINFPVTQVILYNIVIKEKEGKKDIKNERKAGVRKVRLNRPIDKIVKKLVERKFLKWTDSGKSARPTGLTILMNFEHADILKYYNSVVRDLLCYYSFRHNKSRLNSVIHY